MALCVDGRGRGRGRVLVVQGGGPDLRIWFLSVYVDDKYPTVPPAIKFSSKINLDCVDARGNVRVYQQRTPGCTERTLHSLLSSSCHHARSLQVLPARMPYLASWNSSKSIMGALNELKALIARAPRAQPADDATY